MPNPYSTPLPEPACQPNERPTVSQRSLGEIARRVFLSWEKLRVVFIMALSLLTALLTGPDLLRWRVLLFVIEGAVLANLAYFAGPIVETYVCWLGYDRKWVRWFLFVSGTLFTAFLCIGELSFVLHPAQF